MSNVDVSRFSTEEFDKILSDLSELSRTREMSVYIVAMHPLVWNGSWYIRRTNRFFRWLGRRLKNKYVYWIGFQVFWVKGLKEWKEIYQ